MRAVRNDWSGHAGGNYLASTTGSTDIGIGEVVSFDMYADAADAATLPLTRDSRLGNDCATSVTANYGGAGEINGIAFGNVGV